MAEKDQATHSSGKRSAESASSDVHRISHTRDRTVGDANADPQELDTHEGKVETGAEARPTKVPRTGA